MIPCQGQRSLPHCMITKTRVKQALAAIHRYLGLAGCLLFLMWFLSGLVMMYVEMPYLLRTDARLAGLGPLAPAPLVGPRMAIEALGLDAPPQRIFLNVQDGLPVWRVVTRRGQLVTVSAAINEGVHFLGPWSAEEATASALSWGRQSGGWDGPLAFDRTLDLDQWTLYSGLFAQHRPLHRFRVDGPSGTEVYVSQTSGMVVQTTTRKERILGYLGPVTHWIYPTFLRQHGSLWANLVIMLSALGTVAVVLGIVLGLWNLRGRRGKYGYSPYKRRFMRWHHLFGLAFGLVSLTWIFSGMMSMSPFSWAPSTSAREVESRHLAGGEPDWSAFAITPKEALEVFSRQLEVKELEARFFAGRPYWLAWETPKKSLLLPADGASAHPPVAELPASDLETASAGLVANARLSEWQRLDDYDNYYYSKRTFKVRKRLPVYRAVFDDAKKTTFYIDPHTGGIAQRMEPRNRLERYLYQGLHSWDVMGFFNRRPWWDVTVGLFMLGGSFVSLTSVVVAVQWLKRRSA